MQHVDIVQVDILLSTSHLKGLLKARREKTKTSVILLSWSNHCIDYEFLPKQIKETPSTGCKLYYTMSYVGAGICAK